MRKLAENGWKVDKTFAINPVIEGNGGGSWTEPLDVPLNLTELTHNFKMKKLWGTNKKKAKDEDEFVNPTVYTSALLYCVIRIPKTWWRGWALSGAIWMARN